MAMMTPKGIHIVRCLYPMILYPNISIFCWLNWITIKSPLNHR
jgi:hypothetical protein